jgi:signal transduction histidine kinase
MHRPDLRLFLVVAALLAIPAAHPILIPVIGVPSHLLWWAHVLPVALLSFRYGRRGAALVFTVSLVLVLVGERMFGAGYGRPASWETAWALTVALLGTHLLVVGFALYARATARRYQLLFDHAESAILRTDERGRVIAANPASMRLFGCRWEDLKGRTLAEIPWLSPLPAPDVLMQGAWSGALTIGPPGDDATVHVAVAASGGDDPPGHQILFVDRTEEVIRDREIERQGRLATVGAMLAGVAHELKNPLHVIGAYAQLALEPGSTRDETREALETILGQSGRMNDLVAELLGFSRGGSKDDVVHLDDLVHQVVRMQRVARGRQVQLEARVGWRGEVQVSGPKVEQILVNLVSNAVDAAPNGRGVVAVALGEADGDVVVTVTDNGPGIDPGLVDRIFEPFVTTKAEGDGTGLGLAICRRLAASMGATLAAGNRPGGGAMFSLRIPGAAVAPRATAATGVPA